MSSDARLDTPAETAAALGPPRTLIEAAERGDTAAVDALLAAGAPVDATSPTGLTALHKASHLGHTSIVSSLLENGAGVGRTGGDQRLDGVDTRRCLWPRPRSRPITR